VADEERKALGAAIKQFEVRPALRSKIAVTKVAHNDQGKQALVEVTGNTRAFSRGHDQIFPRRRRGINTSLISWLLDI
jgi:hypothetical protein